MKTKKLLALVLALTTLLTVFIIPVGATEEEHNHQDIEIVILNEDISEEAKEKLYAYYSDPDHNYENAEDGTATYGLICSVIGHKIDTSTTYTIQHKARATAPRCLKKSYKYEVCTRCDDYEKSTLITTAYINCCA